MDCCGWRVGGECVGIVFEEFQSSEVSFRGRFCGEGALKADRGIVVGVIERMKRERDNDGEDVHFTVGCSNVGSVLIHPKRRKLRNVKCNGQEFMSE